MVDFFHRNKKKKMQGYDASMMSGMNIMPQYDEYFHLSDATRSLMIATNYVGGCLAVSFCPKPFKDAPAGSCA